MRDFYGEITNNIVAALEKGVQPWFKPWRTNGTIGGIRPLRVTGEPYKGINVVILWVTADSNGYTSPYWMTYNKASELGGQVRKGEKGTMVVFASTFTKTVTNEAHESEEKKIPFLRPYIVFNCDQIDNLPEKFNSKPKAPAAAANPHARIESAEAFFANLGMKVRHGGSRAYYRPSDDIVQLPNFEDFETAQDYYCTQGHESIHWTSAKHRLDRDLGRKRWGDDGYAMEELVAELGSAFVAADLGITAKPRGNHVSYIASWLRVLKDDKRAVFTAAAMAEKAATFLHDLQPAAPVAEPKPAKAKTVKKVAAKVKPTTKPRKVATRKTVAKIAYKKAA